MNLINTKVLPPGYKGYVQIGTEQNAYYDMNPYPYFGFQTWKQEIHGPILKCMPIHRTIIDRFALWLFGKEITFKFTDNENVNKELNRIWKSNNIPNKLVGMARLGGKEGAVALKWDENDDKEIVISILSTISQVKFFRDTHDIEKVVLARIQYPYLDPKDGEWYWFREEWTEDQRISFIPIKIDGYALSQSNPYRFIGSPLFPDIDETSLWEVAGTQPNKWKIIPIIEIKNKNNGTRYGEPDLYNLSRIIDRINFSYHLMDQHNQLQVDPKTVFIDLESKEEDSTNIPAGPGASIDLKTRTPDEEVGEDKVPQGKVEVLESRGDMRTHLRNYANDLKEMIFDATGAVFPRQEQITNKGALTQSVLIQMYAPMLEVIGEKRKTYGEDGICRFLKSLIIGLGNSGKEDFTNYKDKKLYDDELNIELTWFSQFKMTEDEKLANFDRLNREVSAGFVPIERGIDSVAQLEEMIFTEEEKNEAKESVGRNREQQSAEPGKSELRKPGGNRKQEGKPKTQTAGPKVRDAK